MTTTTAPTISDIETGPMTADDIAAEITRQIDEINRERREAEALEQSEAEALEQAQREIEKANRRISEAKDRASAAQMRRRQLELELAWAEAQQLPEPVTLEVARKCGVDLLRAFGAFRGEVYSEITDKRTEGKRKEPLPSLNDRIRAFWAECDRVRNRLLTPEVAGDAVLVTLAAEGLIHACERFTEDLKERPSEDSGYTRAGIGDAPPQCRHCEIAEEELRAVLAGDDPIESESIGELFRQGIELVQAIGMIGLRRPNRQPDLDAFASLVDGPDRHEPAFRFVRWLGAYSIETAWKHRQARLPHRRENNRPHVDVATHGQ